LYNPGALPRRIRLTFPDTGESAVADLLESEAPRLCDAVWALLPLEQTVLHGMYSGPEVFMMLDDPQPIARENQVQLPLPGELLLFHDEGTSAAGRNRVVSEICLVYGRGVTLRQHEGVPTHAGLFARIPGDWLRDWTAFAQACRRVRTAGPRTLRIERA
jgi:hypothetical protein